MGFLDWLSPTSGSPKCCKKCLYFTNWNEYDRFYCEGINQEIIYDMYAEKENIKKSCLCNTKYDRSGDYFRWR